MKRYGLILMACLLFTAVSSALYAQDYPRQDGDKSRYSAYIELPRGAYLSGICYLVRQGDELRGSLFNEFGFSALDFSYSLRKDKVRLLSVIEMMDKWYIRRTLRRDLRKLLKVLEAGGTQYINQRRGITYTLTPLTNNHIGQ